MLNSDRLPRGKSERYWAAVYWGTPLDPRDVVVFEHLPSDRLERLEAMASAAGWHIVSGAHVREEVARWAWKSHAQNQTPGRPVLRLV